MRTSARVAGLAGGQVATWVTTLVWLLVVPRHLGVDDFGRYVFATTALTVVCSLSLFGLDVQLVRSVARRDDPAQIRAAAVAAIVGSAVVIPGAGLALVPAVGASTALLLALGHLALAVGNIAYAVLQGDDRPGLRARWDVVAKTVFVVGSLATTSLPGVACSFALGYGAFACAGWTFVRRLHLVERGRVRSFEVHKVLRESAPVGVHLAAQSVYYRSDSVLLGPLSGAVAVGVYGAAYKLFDTLSFVTGLFAAVVAPRLVRLVRDDVPSARRLLVQCVLSMAAMGGAVAVVTAAVSGSVVAWIFGSAYSSSGHLLRILVVALAISFVVTPVSWALYACDQQRRLAAVSLCAAVVNVGTNVVLIPAYGSVGAAWTTVLTEVVVLVGQMCSLRGTPFMSGVRHGRVHVGRSDRSDCMTGAHANV